MPCTLRLPNKFIWKIYFLFYALLTATNIVYFFHPESPAILYYHILIAWDSMLIIFYIQNIAAILFNTMTIFPFWAYLYDRHFLSPKFWICFFWTRLILEFVGRSYEANYIKSIYVNDQTTAYLMILTLITLNAPSYFALWLYAKSLSRRD